MAATLPELEMLNKADYRSFNTQQVSQGVSSVRFIPLRNKSIAVRILSSEDVVGGGG